MNKEYLSFECYCVEVAGITYYNWIAEEDYENIFEDYVEYCENRDLDHD